MGSAKAPSLFLLLLLFITGTYQGAAQTQADDASQDKDIVFLHVETVEIQDVGPVHMEEIASTKIPVHRLNRGSPICSACEDFANKAVGYLSDKQTQDKIVEVLHDVCSQTFSLEQKCVELMDSYATLLFAKVTEIKPEEFCKQYGLCRETTLFSGLKSDSTCVFCRHMLDEVMSKLKDPDAEFEVIQILLKECNKMEGHVQQNGVSWPRRMSCLNLQDNERLASLPNGLASYSSLADLTIRGCPGIKSLPSSLERRLPSIEETDLKLDDRY